MPGPLDFIKNIFTGGLDKLGGTVKEIIDESKYSAEEKAELGLKLQEAIYKNQVEMTTLANAEIDSYLKDSQSARDANARIQESDKASWLAKNLAYCMDAFVMLSFVAMLVMIFFKQVPEPNKEIFYTAFGILGYAVSQTMNFHRGTSIGSKNSGDVLRKLASKNENSQNS